METEVLWKRWLIDYAGSKKGACLFFKKSRIQIGNCSSNEINATPAKDVLRWDLMI